MAGVLEQAFRLFNMTPVLAEMRATPRWAPALTDAVASPELAALRPTVTAIATNGPATLQPWHAFLNGPAATIDPVTYAHATAVAQQLLATDPPAALLLSLLSLSGWTAALGDQLYAQPGGMPHPGWATIPYGLAEAGLRLGCLDGVTALIADSYDVLMAAKHQFDPRLREALDAYRTLAGRAERAVEIAIANLADDLRDACRPGPDSMRPQFGALLWTLGMVPESLLFRAGDDTGVLPTRRFFQSVVRQSLDHLAHDSLIQYLWLELKDRPPMDLRSHRGLFMRINADFHQQPLDDLLPVAPSRSYARTLIGVFRGALDPAEADDYLQVEQLLQSSFPDIDQLLFVRTTAHAYAVAQHSGRLLDHPATDFWRNLAGLAADIRYRADRHPDWPELGQRLNAPLFQYAQETLAAGDPDAALAAIEHYRVAALDYWLRIAPPLVGADVPAADTDLGRQESELLGYLRGAYFLTLFPTLPRHYHRYGRTLDDALDGPAQLDPDVGRSQLQDLSTELTDLYQRSAPTAPLYVAKRLAPTADLDRMAASLGL